MPAAESNQAEHGGRLVLEPVEKLEPVDKLRIRVL